MQATAIVGKQSADTMTPSSPDPNSVFLRFSERMVIVIIDVFIAVFVGQTVGQYIIDAIGISISNYHPINLAAALLYFVTSWASPMRATPVQYLFGARVVDKSGNNLGLARALVRGVLLVTLIAAAFTLFEVPDNPHLGIIVLAAYALLFLAAVTPNRQAVHDYIVRSFVIRKSALNSPALRAHLLEYASDNCPVSRRQRRPSILNIAGDAIMLAIPVFVVYTFASIDYQRELRHRTSYAVTQTAPLRIAINEYYMDLKRLPADATEVGFSARTEYPDGGYYELEENGAIRIRFTVKPELRNGSIILDPTIEDDSIIWECRFEGDISPAHLPTMCR